MAARWWRIAPPYYAAMAVYLAAPAVYLMIGYASPLTRLLSVRQVGSHLLLAHGLWPDTIDGINTAFWSLSLEFQFYLALPALFWLSVRVGVLPLAVAVALASACWRWVVVTRWAGHGYLVNGFLLGRLTEFLLGMGVAFWYNAPGRVLRALVAPVVAAVALMGAAVWLDVSGYPLVTDYVFGASYAMLLTAALIAPERHTFLGRVFEWRPLVWVGTISYSLYLTHSLLLERGIQVYRRFVPHSLLAADCISAVVILGLVVVGGWGFYALIEHRFIRSVDAKKSPAQSGPPTVLDAAPAVSAPLP